MTLTLLRCIPGISTIEGKLFHLFETGGNLLTFTVALLNDLLRPPYEFSEIRRHMDELGAKSLPLAGTTGVIMGLILAIQSRPVMERFGAEMYVPVLVSVSVVRELGPRSEEHTSELQSQR